MREILFRAKRIDNGEWVEGYYVKTTLGKDIEPSDVIFVPWNINRSEQWGWIKVLTETLCQYIGLKDKNGKRIWENDIVRIENSMDEGIGNIEFYGGMWYVDGKPSNSLYDIVEYDDADVEVIGNIFDNPELMKEQ